MENTYEDIFLHVLPALESKKSEFKVYNYGTVTENDIWKYCITKKWRKQNIATLPLHRIVNDVLSVTPAEYMTFVQIQNSRTSNWFSEINQEELKLLLNPKIGEE